jgi:hypothetical protein
MSTAKEALTSHAINNNGQMEAQELSKKMQHANFAIGDTKNRNLNNVQTSYQQTISGAASSKN